MSEETANKEASKPADRPAAKAAGAGEGRGERSERGDRPERSERPRRQGGGRFQRRRKFCKFCADKSLKIDHKDPALLGQFITERQKIIPARVTGTCAKHQRALTTAVKRARILALLAFTPLHHD